MAEMTTSGAAIGAAARRTLDRQHLMRLADGLAVALAVSLPWSTSATSILAALWILTVLPTLKAVELRQVLLTPAGGLPVLLCLLAILGMTWANVPFAERIGGIGSFGKLLVIPLLMIHFRRSDAAKWVTLGFVCSCAALLVVSWMLYALPGLSWRGNTPGVPVKNYSSQADMFTIAIFIVAAIALYLWRTGRLRLAVTYGLSTLAFLANILYIAPTRTALVAFTVLLGVFGLKKFSWKAAIAMLVLLIAIGAAAWPSAQFLQVKVGTFLTELDLYRTENVRTSAGERLEFWKKSVGFIADAPVIGHGTGSILDQFRNSVSGIDGASSIASANPHNQVLAVGIQLGFVGIAALLAMWMCHLVLFRGEGLAAWIGLVIVIQNLVGSLFNSELFDFTQGWAYVIGVGVAGGAVMRAGLQPAPNTASSKQPSAPTGAI